MIRDLAGTGVAVLLSTHDPDAAARLAGQVVLIGTGGMLASGPVDRVMTGALLSRLYGLPVRAEAVAGGRVFLAG